MRWLLRSAVAATMVATLGVAPGTAHAGAGAFSGTVQIDCYGCGSSNGTGEFVLEGVGPFNAVFTINSPTGTDCMVTSNAQGGFSGAVNGTFTWLQLFDHLDIRTNGLPGEATFLVTSPFGIPCGGPITAFVSGTLVF